MREKILILLYNNMNIQKVNTIELLYSLRQVTSKIKLVLVVLVFSADNWFIEYILSTACVCFNFELIYRWI